MDQSAPVWLIPALMLVSGIIIGVILARVLRGTAPGKTQQQLVELQERFDSYQSEVVTHFNTTALLVRKLTQNYQDVQEHLSTGAERLALDEETRERLLAGLAGEPKAPERINAPEKSQPETLTEPVVETAELKESEAVQEPETLTELEPKEPEAAQEPEAPTEPLEPQEPLEPPRDYAKKKEGDIGMLDEGYGRKR